MNQWLLFSALSELLQGDTLSRLHNATIRTMVISGVGSTGLIALVWRLKIEMFCRRAIAVELLFGPE